MGRRTEIAIPHERRNGNARNPAEDDLKGADEEAFRSVLGEVIATFEGHEIPYTLMGGIASTGFGRPRWTHDIDAFVKPEDVDRILVLLAERGFRTEITDPDWLAKAFKLDVMVDIIFRSTGGFYLDQAMVDRAVRTGFHGHMVRLIPPEDLLIIKAVVHDEAGPRHWHDALAIIATTRLDWDYLLCRANKAPRRVLSLLLYAHSLDLSVPNRVVRDLYRSVYES